jgi:hypothetical protein
MKIQKCGIRRNCGRTLLADHDLTKDVPSHAAIEWAEDCKTLWIAVTGHDNNSSYRYTITLSASELSTIISSMFSNNPNLALRTHVKGFSAFLEEIQREPGKT